MRLSRSFSLLQAEGQLESFDLSWVVSLPQGNISSIHYIRFIRYICLSPALTPGRLGRKMPSPSHWSIWGRCLVWDEMMFNSRRLFQLRLGPRLGFGWRFPARVTPAPVSSLLLRSQRLWIWSRAGPIRGWVEPAEAGFGWIVSITKDLVLFLFYSCFTL